MKRILTIITLAALLLTACGSQSGDGGTKPVQTAKQVGVAKSDDAAAVARQSSGEAKEETSSKQQSKILVAYYTPRRER